MDAHEGIHMNHPAHRGAFVEYEVIEPSGLSVAEAARMLGVTQAALSAFLNERSSLSPEMAMLVERAFGISMDTRMRMQLNLDIANARRELGELSVQPYHTPTLPS